MRLAHCKCLNLNSVHIGYWINVGSFDESHKESGIAHFLEHMVFKGTATRTAQQIAYEIEDVGGYINAYTSREVTAFYARVLKKDIFLAADILTEMLTEPKFPEDELERERAVVLQEILQARDTPDDVIFDHFYHALYGSHAYSHPVLGYDHILKSLNSQDLERFRKKYYVSENIVMAIVGDVEEEEAVRIGERYALRFSTGQKTDARLVTSVHGRYFADVRDIEQVHVLLGCVGVKVSHPDYYTSQLYASILGSGSSSRLFQEIREMKGLAYSIYACSTSTSKTGSFYIYSATSPEYVPELLFSLREQIQKMSEDVSTEELCRAKAQMQASILMTADNPFGVCEQMASHALLFGRLLADEEVLDNISSVQREMVLQYAQTISRMDCTLCTVGSQRYDALQEAKVCEG